jgi:hypothetical protein
MEQSNSTAAADGKGTEPAKDSRKDPVTIAREYGTDISLLQANLRRTPAERLRQLDAMLNFVRRARRV